MTIQKLNYISDINISKTLRQFNVIPLCSVDYDALKLKKGLRHVQDRIKAVNLIVLYRVILIWLKVLKEQWGNKEIKFWISTSKHTILFTPESRINTTVHLIDRCEQLKRVTFSY